MSLSLSWYTDLCRVTPTAKCDYATTRDSVLGFTRGIRALTLHPGNVGARIRSGELFWIRAEDPRSYVAVW